jgi:hypothetical protein
MKKHLQELKEQLQILKDKIVLIESKIDESDNDVLIINKSDFMLIDVKIDGGYTFFNYKECLFRIDNMSNNLKLFKEGQLEFMVIKKMKNTQSWCYGRIILTHTLLNDIEAAKYVYYST